MTFSGFEKTLAPLFLFSSRDILLKRICLPAKTTAKEVMTETEEIGGSGDVT
jgi:hypothetical protein